MPISRDFLDGIDFNSQSIINLSNQYPYLNDKDIIGLVEAIELKKVYIKGIVLSENNIGDSAANILCNLKDLEVLDIGTNCITDQGAKSIGRIKTLLDLDISDNNISDEGLSHIIKNLPKLRALAFTSKSLGDKTIQVIVEHPRLEEVVIFDDENVESDVLEQINKHTENNKKKNEVDKSIIDNKQLEELANQLKNVNFSKKQTFFTQQEPAKVRENTRTKQENLLKQALEILKSISDPQEQELFKEDLANSILRLNILDNSPECKG